MSGFPGVLALIVNRASMFGLSYNLFTSLVAYFKIFIFVVLS